MQNRNVKARNVKASGTVPIILGLYSTTVYYIFYYTDCSLVNVARFLQKILY